MRLPLPTFIIFNGGPCHTQYRDLHNTHTISFIKFSSVQSYVEYKVKPPKNTQYFVKFGLSYLRILIWTFTKWCRKTGLRKFVSQKNLNHQIYKISFWNLFKNVSIKLKISLNEIKSFILTFYNTPDKWSGIISAILRKLVVF